MQAVHCTQASFPAALSLIYLVLVVCVHSTTLRAAPLVDDESTTIETKKSTADEINAFGLELFGAGGSSAAKSLTVGETLALLEKLRTLFRRQAKEAGGLDTRTPGSDKWQEATHELLATKRDFDAGCDENYYQKVNAVSGLLHKYNEQQFGANVGQFLRGLAVGFYADCVASMRRKIVRELSGDQRNRLKQLSHTINHELSESRLKLNEDGHWTRSSNWSGHLCGIYGCGRQVGARGARANWEDYCRDKELFLDRYDNFVDAACSSVVAGLDLPIRAIRDCPIAEYLTAVDQEARDWMRVYDACAYVRQTFGAYLHEYYLK